MNVLFGRNGDTTPWWRDEAPFPKRYKLTNHARERMRRRAITDEAIEATLTYGRICQGPVATLYVLGRHEVDWLYQQGIDLTQHEGVRVVCCGHVILTVYRSLASRGA